MTHAFEGPFSSIRSKSIAIFVILGVIPLILVGFFAYKTASNALLNQTREQLGNLADKTAQQVDTFFEVCEKDINLLSNFPFIQLAFLQYEFGQRLDTVERLLEEHGKKNPYYQRIYLAGLDGQPILSISRTRQKAGGADPAPAWFRAAREKDLFLSDVTLGSGPRDAFVVMTKKIHDFEDPARPVGILAFEIRLAAVTAFVSSLTIGTRGYAFLFNSRGMLLYHPDPELNLSSGFLKNGDKKFSALVHQMQAGHSGSGHYRFNGQRKYMVFTPCRVKPWQVGITLLRSEFMADIIKLRQSIVTFSTLIVALIVLVSLLFARSLTLPISQLVTGARAIGAGDLDQKISVASSQELQGLAGEFNRMAARLKSSMQKIVDLKTFSDDALRSVSSGIITVDKKGGLTFINRSAAKIFSFGPHNSQGRADTFPLGVKKTMALLMMTLGKKQLLEHQVIDFENDQGAPVFIEINTSLLYDGKGRITGAIADIRDITARKRMDQLMIRVDRLASLGELSAGIAHEIRNPLAGMKTSIQVLAKHLSTPSHLMLARGVLDEIDRLNQIVTDLLKFSGPSPNFPCSVEISTVIQKTLDLLMERMKKRDIRVIQHHDPDLAPAFIDKEQIQQVFLNLVLNAVNAMPGGGTLTIAAARAQDQDNVRDNVRGWVRDPKKGAHGPDPSVAAENGYIAVSFTDTGPGIKKENLARVFDPFFTTDPNGTGLGLSIAHKLLEKNQAFIHIDSRQGQGCRVLVMIPCAADSPQILTPIEEICHDPGTHTDY